MMRIASVIPGGPADNAGVLKGDLLMHVDGEDCTGLSNVQIASAIKAGGPTIQLLVASAPDQSGILQSIKKQGRSNEVPGPPATFDVRSTVDACTKARAVFAVPVQARYVQINVLEWQGVIAMRAAARVYRWRGDVDDLEAQERHIRSALKSTDLTAPGTRRSMYSIPPAISASPAGGSLRRGCSTVRSPAADLGSGSPRPARIEGIAIEHLTKVLRIECLSSLATKLNRFAEIGRLDLDVDDMPRQPWRDPLVNPQDATIWHMVHGHVIGLTKHMGCSYVDFVRRKTHPHHVFRAMAMISYTWGDSCEAVFKALELWCVGSRRRVSETSVWICSLCVNQHDLPKDLALTFKTRVEAIGMLLPLMVPWDKPKYVKRLWCLFELWTSTTAGIVVELIFPPAELKRLEQVSLYGNFASYNEQVLAGINCETAETSFESDTLAIRAQIQNYCMGGFGLLDATIRQRLRAFFTGLQDRWIPLAGLPVIEGIYDESPYTQAELEEYHVYLDGFQGGIFRLSGPNYVAINAHDAALSASREDRSYSEILSAEDGPVHVGPGDSESGYIDPEFGDGFVIPRDPPTLALLGASANETDQESPYDEPVLACSADRPSGARHACLVLPAIVPAFVPSKEQTYEWSSTAGRVGFSMGLHTPHETAAKQTKVVAPVVVTVHGDIITATAPKTGEEQEEKEEEGEEEVIGFRDFGIN